MEKEVIKYFKEWTIPTNWDDISLRKYQEIERFYEGKDENVDIRKIIHIMADKTEDEVNELPAEFLEIILEKLLFLQNPPESFKDATNRIVIDGETYLVNVMEKLKLGEYVAVDTVLKADKHDYASILAILCRKEGEPYDSKFEAEEFERRKELFERQSIVDILPIITFFLKCYIVSGKHSQLYSLVEEELNRIQQNIRTSGKIGAFKRLRLNLQVKKLQKLLKSIKSS